MYVLNLILETKMGDRGKLLVKLALDKNAEGDIRRKVEFGEKCNETNESIADCSGKSENDLKSKHWFMCILYYFHIIIL